MNTERQDVYTRVTAKIVADLENGVRPWLKPWNAANTNGPSLTMPSAPPFMVPPPNRRERRTFKFIGTPTATMKGRL